MENILMLADSYKYSHFKQYPPNMVGMFDYAEARSGKVYRKTVFFGLQYYIKKYLSKPFTQADIDEAASYAKKHGVPFPKEGFEYILEKYNGYLPVKIKAVPEGTVVPTGNVLFTIESTDEEVPWVVGFLETLLLKVWYPSNIATRSYYVKKMLRRFWEQTEPEENFPGIGFQFHNFGDRGSTSVEAAALGGVAHLTQFLGTDNFDSLKYAEEFYDEPDAGFSIPATEHSTTISWGKDGEITMIHNHIKTFKDSPIIAAVCDSYDYLNAVNELTTGPMKDLIEKDDTPKLVIRPDSGDPVELISATLDIFERNEIEISINSKGYKTPKHYGIIWGDGVNESTMEEMLKTLVRKGWAASTIAFGSGGWLMQEHTRDTQGWAIKCSSVTLDEGAPEEGSMWKPLFVERDVYKEPLTDKKKVSKKGRISLYKNVEGEFKTLKDSEAYSGWKNVMETVYDNGSIINTYTLNNIRERSNYEPEQTY